MNFVNTYINLGDSFFERTSPSPVANPQLLLWNAPLAKQLNVEGSPTNNSDQLAQLFSGNQIPAGANPIALAYAGHQFGSFNPQLGDGRAHLLGEVLDQSGQRFDIQLKGSGRTRYSRGGDGRCALGPAIREFIMSEAMHALGVPTSRCLAVVATGEDVYRDTIQPGAVVTRIASSHLRVGTFQYFAAQQDIDSLHALTQYTINRHFPTIDTTGNARYLMLLDRIIEKQLHMVVQWMRVGFIHGVMNTDNTPICGETLDFGPCAMLGDYNPNAVFSSIDHGGRYAFGNQPGIIQWNMAKLAECLLMLCDADDESVIEPFQELISEFPTRFGLSYKTMLANKFGLTPLNSANEELMFRLLDTMSTKKLDYTSTFHQLSQSLTATEFCNSLRLTLGEDYDRWVQSVTQQSPQVSRAQATMRKSNPVIIPRNHQVEAVIRDCVNTKSIESAERFLEALRHPYVESANQQAYLSPAEDRDEGYKTFCGT